MKKIVVNDTNVFIDLYEVGLLEDFFSLPWEVHTTDFVMLELQREGQHETVARYKADKRLVVPVFEAKELLEIGNMYQQYLNRTNLSLTDCSVWYYAKVNKYILLTGDRKLRTASTYDGVEVHGVIYVFDCLVRNLIYQRIQMDVTISDDDLRREAMELYGERYPDMSPNEWRHVVEAYTPMVREAARPKSQEISIQQYGMAAEPD